MESTTKEKTELEQFQALRIEALEKELERINEELLEVKNTAFKTRLTDPKFFRPLSEIETSYEIIPIKTQE